MAKVKEDFTALHSATKDAEPEEYSFTAGDEVQILKEWDNHYLLKNGDGKLFNVEKHLIDADS